MADVQILRAEPRTVHGKKVGRLRREGLIPGVIYGPVLKDTISVSVNSREFGRFFNRVGHSTVFNLEWDGGSQPVLIREVQVDPVRGDHLHIDFFAPNMRVKLRQSVPVVLVNHSEDAQGILNQTLTEVEVEALPSDLPQQIDADISSLLAVGDSIRVADLTAPNGVEITVDGEETVASLIAETVEPEPEEVEETEEGEAEEGEESTESTDSEGESESSEE